MQLPETTSSAQPGFRVVCEDCGSLSIKIAEIATDFPKHVIVRCGRCSAVRGTLADLHVLARSGRDIFEF
jgi:hypothetical protein